MYIIDFPLGPLETNAFLVHDDKEAIIFDVGGEPSSVLAYLKSKRLKLTHIFLTHLHFDHTFGVHALATATEAPTYASNEDAFMLKDGGGRGGVWGLPRVEAYEYQDLEPGTLQLLGVTCNILPTPGHTPGGLSFYFPDLKAVFVGDTLFYRSIGRTDFPRGSFEILARSIQKQLFTLPEDTIAYPGHGPATKIGDEKLNNPYVSVFTL